MDSQKLLYVTASTVEVFPLHEIQDQVEKGQCPNGLVTVTTTRIYAKGCDEDEARRKLLGKLLGKGEAMRPCTGKCNDGECTGVLTGVTNILCTVGRVKGCKDDVGMVCGYTGTYTYGCVFA